MDGADLQRRLPAEEEYADSGSKLLSIPPQHIQAEQAVLGAILIRNEEFEKINDILIEDDFYQEKHRIIYQSIIHLVENREPVDVLTIQNHLKSNGDLDTIGGTSYLVSLVQETPYATNTEAYARIVQDCSILRQLVKYSQDIQQIVRNRRDKPAELVLGEVQQLIFSLGRKYDRGEGLRHVRDVALEACNRIQELYENPSKDGLTGVPSGFTDLDRKTSGLQNSDLIVIAGRPGMGKSTLAMNIAEYAAINAGLSVAIFSLEMPAVQLSMRTLASLSSINLSLIRDGKLGDGNVGRENWSRLKHALDMLDNASIWIDCSTAISPLEISARARRLKRESGLDLVLVDYLQLLQMKENVENRATELANITRELKFLARELNIPVVALSQLNRTLERRTDKRPLMSDLRESGAIEQDADLIIFVHRESEYNQDAEDDRSAELRIAKHRNGETGTVKLVFMKEFTRFMDYSEYSDDELAPHY